MEKQNITISLLFSLSRLPRSSTDHYSHTGAAARVVGVSGGWLVYPEGGWCAQRAAGIICTARCTGLHMVLAEQPQPPGWVASTEALILMGLPEIPESRTSCYCLPDGE